MKLILMTTPFFFVEEHQILNALFEEGLDTLHLNKPGTEPVYSERLLSLIAETHRKRIVVHDHFYLKSEYGLRGIHLSAGQTPPTGYKGQVSLTCRTAEELVRSKSQGEYALLEPTFQTGSDAGFSPAELREMSQSRIIDRKVMALGGISPERIDDARAYGFGGVVVRGALWEAFDIHAANDFKDVINQFRRLRRIVTA